MGQSSAAINSRGYLENVVSAGTTYTFGSTADSGMSNANFSASLGNVSVIAMGVFIISSPTLSTI